MDHNTATVLGVAFPILFQLAFWFFFFVFVFSPMYIAYSLLLYLLAKKYERNDLMWIAWVPWARVHVSTELAGKPAFWTLLRIFVPGVKIILNILVWMEIAKRRGFPEWLGVFVLVPFGNFVVPGILALLEPDQTGLGQYATGQGNQARQSPPAESATTAGDALQSEGEASEGLQA